MVTEAEQFSKDPSRRHVNSKRLRIVELLYAFMAVLSFYLLVASRSGEVYTVWEVMHPAFIPVFFVTTVLLLVIIFSSERVEYKLLLTIVHSILSHVFFVVVFPAGYFGAQQMTLGEIRLVYDNVIFGGIPLESENILAQIYNLSRGINFETALSVILTRMFGIDIFWSHLFFVPLLWGTFVPVATFLVTRAFCENENISVLSSFLISLFPTSIIFGTYSMHFTVGCIFFFCSFYFILKYLFTNGLKASFLMIIFSSASLVSHPLTGIMSIAFILLAVTLKNYENEKAKYPLSTEISLLLSFLFCTSLLPFVLVSVAPHVIAIYTRFSLDKLYQLSSTEIVGEFILGEYVNFSLMGALICGLGPLLGFIGMIYISRSGVNAGSNKTRRVSALFLLMGFLVVLVDYRILRLFMVDVPFGEDRLWVFRDFMAAPFVAFVVSGIMTSLQKTTSKHGRIHVQFLFSKLSSALRVIIPFAMILLLSGWVTASVYYAYPHYGPLQTTPYELEAAKYMDKNTTERYIVICDQWITYAGGMIVGIHNPCAFYFSIEDPEGIKLFNKMKMNASIDIMVEAMNTYNASTAYFIIEKLRIGEDEYSRIIQQAQQNKLQTYKIFYYPEGEEKLHIFYYKKG